jgi:bifunctional non-homologous end joining protein LigD
MEGAPPLGEDSRMTAAEGQLSEYRRKRDFGATPEPAPAEAVADAAGPLRFMVHKHAATRLHYDLRLELDGVLKSWAIPKGPSCDPAQKRLAAATEDHPFDYGAFEGIIPRGSYGAGPSLVWDSGTFSPDEKGGMWFDDRAEAERQFRDGLAAGKVSVTLRGRKLKGSWALVKTKDAWLMLKHRDEAADPGRDLIIDATSVISGMTIDEHRARNGPPRTSGPWHFSPASLTGARPGPMPVIEPMLATLSPIPGNGNQWSYEPKLDGIRAIVSLKDGLVKMRSRRGMEMADRYPAISAQLSRQPANSCVLDGEIVAVGADGRLSFELLQQRMNLAKAEEIAAAERAIPTMFYAFDILYLDGWDLTRTPLEERRELLARLLLPTAHVAPITVIPLDAGQAYEAAIGAGFEGIIAKRRGSLYEAGKRSPAWLKRKALDNDTFVVGGYTPGLRSRQSTFGGLLLGARQPDGSLVYRGRVGSGFTESELAELMPRLEALRTDRNPFGVEVPDERLAHFVRPELEVVTEYLDITAGGQLRAPVFKGFPGQMAREARVQADVTDTESTIIGQLEAPAQKLTLEGDGWRLPVTNLDKELWPATTGRRAITKRDLLVYAVKIYPTIERHLRDRPITLTRFPNGISATKFYQRHSDLGPPAFVDKVAMFSDTEQRDRDFLLCNNLPTLLWLCQLADLEFHASLARVTNEPDARHATTVFTGSLEALERSVLNYPDFILFDLDPYIYEGTEKKGDEPQPNEAAFRAACSAARGLKEILDALGMASFVKSSGATGVHVYVPIVRNLNYAEVRAAANTICTELLVRRPDELTMEWATEKRTGKVFLDANQNGRGRSLAAAYSPRAKPGAPVSLPETWETLGEVYPGSCSILDVPGIVEARGDPWANILEAKQDLVSLLGR